MTETREALLDSNAPADARAILAPTVGRYHAPPPRGALLAPGAPAGELRVLTRTIRLVLPEGAEGAVGEVLVPHPAFVERGTPLFVLAPAGALAAASAAGPAAAIAKAAAAAAGVPEGLIAVRAPTDGIFYRKPAPDEPPYVEEGDEIEPGAVLGLVEVMKCFNQITWTPAPGGPARAKVERIAARESAEVKQHAPLFLLRPS